MDNTIVPVENDFRPVETSIPGNTLIATEAAKEVATVQAAVVMAKRFPRDRYTAFENIMQDCQRRQLATSAVYSYPRGGSTVEGPSIRLAECMANNWGNIDFGVRELSRDDDKSVCEAYAWDLETNTRSTRIFEVPHMRHTRNGSYKLTDSRDIYENIANNGSRRMRACILQIIPGDVVEKSVMACKKTVTSGGGEPLKDRLQKIILALGKFGVKAEHVERRLGYNLNSATEDDLFSLMTILNSLKDGHSKRSAFFDIADAEQTEKTKSLKSKLNGDPDPKSPEGKQLSAELDQLAANQQ